MTARVARHTLGPLDLLQNPVWIFDEEGNRLWWANLAAMRLAGASSREELLTRRISEVVVKGSSGLLALGLDFGADDKFRQRWTFATPEGPRPIDCDCSGVALEDGSPGLLAEGRVDGAGLTATQRALTEVKRLLSAILNNTPIGLAILDADHVVRLANRAFCEMFRGTPDELQGRSVARLFGPENKFESVCRHSDPLIAAGGTFHLEMKMYRLDGDEIWCSLSARLVDETEPALGVVWAATNITQRVQQQGMLSEARDKLERQAAELARSNAELEQFAYVASHDLRQPLRLISSYVTLLERKYRDQLDDDGRQFIAFARDGAQRMDRLIVDLLEYSRIGRQHRESGPVSLSDVMADSILNLKISIQETGAIIKTAESLPTVRGNLVDLVRLFQNLIGNAIKYHAEDRVPVVEISARREGPDCVVAVSDNGIGIDPSQFDRIFMIFQRLHARNEYEGTGIGLAICRKVVDQLGGKLWVTSRPGEGSVFQAQLPLAGDEDSPA